jgi:glycine/D-amino acid oxidase-like deaminating enzyme
MATIGSKRSLASWITGYGKERAVRLWRAARDSVDFLEQLITDEGIDCHWDRCGFLNVAWKPEHFGRLAEKQRLLAEVVGHETRLVTPRDLDEELSCTTYHGGLVDEHAGGLHPALFARGLAEAARAAGAVVHENTPVLRKERAGSRQLLHTPRGRVLAGEVLVATNAYTGQVTPRLRRCVVPVGSQIIATEPLPADLAAELIPHRRMVFDTKNLLFYFRLTPDARLLFGGRASFAGGSAARVGSVLRGQMEALFPQLTGRRIEYVWQGFVGYTPDLDPYVGRLGPDHYALGYCGHGVSLATYLGDRVARFMMGEGEPDPFIDLRPPRPIPLYYGKPWFMPAGAAYYRILDVVR